MKIQFIFRWYDFWIGVFYDRKKRWIYFLPVPMVGIVIKLPSPKKIAPLAIVLLSFMHFSCSHAVRNENRIADSGLKTYQDTTFVQEYHEAYFISKNSEDNEVRGIAVDQESNVLVAAASGIFMKGKNSGTWSPVITGEDRGPAYDVAVEQDGAVLLGTWNGLYLFKNGNLQKVRGIKPPVSVICTRGSDAYALGPFGIWQIKGGEIIKQDYKIPRSVRDAFTDGGGNLWVGTDAGLYLCKDNAVNLFQDTSELISCYVRSVSPGPRGEIWAGVLGGVSVRRDNKLVRNLTPENGIPSAGISCIRQAPDGTMWVGTDEGVVRYATDYTHSLRFSRRWLTDNRVKDVAFDRDGNAWIATRNGVSAIKRKMMTLADKERYFYDQLMRKHIRAPWICGNLRLDVPGDTSVWHNSDDDNDGEYTGGYLAMESFRFAATGDDDAREKARRAFGFLKFLQEVTGTGGFFARTIVPADWTEVHDGNRTYTPQQIADELVSDPRYKPVEQRWHLSADGKWKWKGDTSSDEMDGHMMGYFYFYEFAASEEDKQAVRDHVRKIMDHLIETGYNLVDADGTHTRWGVWSPEQLNGDPDWASERSLNSFELLAYLKFVGHITGDVKYEKEYRRLIEKEGYLENVSKLNSKNPAWQIYFDLTMEGYLFPILIKYETDPELKKFYRELMDEWMAKQTAGENLLNNLAYELATGKRVNVSQTVEFLKDTPLDLVDWYIDHRVREDVHLVRRPILEEVQVSELPPPSIRATVRWDKNPWAAASGDPRQVREPNFWLWPYWMARYLGIIKADGS
jgi:hypothetical protein